MRFVLSLVIISFSLFAAAQDIHFSQFYVSPMLQNPANAGFFNCDYRFTAIYKSQWNSITVPYTTFAASYDMRFIRKHTDSKEIKSTKDYYGAGIVFTNDKSGDGSFSRPDVGLAGAYHKCLDRYGRNYFGGGLLLSYGEGIIDYSKLLFPSSYSYPNGPILPSGEPYFHNYNYFDVSAGVNYTYIFIDKDKHFQDKYFQVGFAAYHINQPQQSFIQNFGIPPPILPVKFVLNASFQYRINDKIELYPKINISYQGVDKEYLLGTFARVDLSQQDDYGVYLGTWVRAGDAVIAVVRFDVENISLSFSYDITTTPPLLATASEERGGPEFSIIYIGCLPKHSSKAVFCPRF